MSARTNECSTGTAASDDLLCLLRGSVTLTRDRSPLVSGVAVATGSYWTIAWFTKFGKSSMSIPRSEVVFFCELVDCDSRSREYEGYVKAFENRDADVTNN